jgi:WD40 repeat protein
MAIPEGEEIEVRLLRGPDAEVLDLAFSPDGTAIAAGFKHHPVHLWNLEAATPAPVRMVAEGGYTPGGLQFAPDGRSLWWRRVDGRGGYDRDTRDYLNQSFAISVTSHNAFASASGVRVISQHAMPDYCLVGWEWTKAGWMRRWTVSIADLALESLTLSGDGAYLGLIARNALGGRWIENPRQVELWDGTTGKVLSTGHYPYAYAPRLHFAPDAHQLVGINDMTLLVWSAPGLGEPRLIRNDNRKDYTAVAFHPAGRRLYAASNDGTVQLFDTENWERVERFSWKIGRPKSVAVNAEGTLAAAGGEGGEIVIWDVDE